MSEDPLLRQAGTAESGAIRTLRALLIGTIVVPILLGLVGGYFSYRTTYQRAAAALGEAVAVAEENTTKILDTHVLVAARIDDLLVGQSDEELAAREKSLHEQIAQQIADLPQVAAAWAVNRDGRELVSARVYPVNREFDNSSREDFRALRDDDLKTYIRAVRARSLGSGDFQAYFTVSQRRRSLDGSFRGIIVVAVSGPYFASFYNSLLGGSAQYTASVLLDDGTTLARYPQTAAPAATGREDELLAAALARKTTAGIIATGTALDDAGSLIAYKRLANYPVYVAIGRTRHSIAQEWLETMAGYAAVGIPAAIGLILLCLVALGRTRREQSALAAARDAMAERAAIEAQLHQAQKMEAVGLLTAGIAHDFNNLITIIAGNVSLLGAQSDPADAKCQRQIAAVLNACDRAAALSKRLLGFARREPVDPREVDINQLIYSLSELPWRSLGDRVTLELRLADALWPVFVDPIQLENALLNLALNAHDAMQGEGRLIVETANFRCGEAEAANHAPVPPGEYVAVVVSDTGHGMSPEVRDKAFDAFFTTKEAGKGTGLGLAQVHGFITRCGGFCAIDSTPGHGTIVRLYLPRHLGGSGEAAGDAARAQPAARATAK